MSRNKIVIFVVLWLAIGNFSQMFASYENHQKEDEMILHALEYKNQKQLKKSLELFEKLYKNDKNRQYLKEIVLLKLSLQDINGAKKALKKDESIIELFDAKTAAMIYESISEPKKALEQLELSCFKKNNIETCGVLINVYEKQKKYQKLAEVLGKLYKHFKDEGDMMKSQTIQAALSELISSLPQKLQNETYGKLFESTNDINFLAKQAMSEYEMAPANAKPIKSVSEKFEKVLETSTNHQYQNYYGYLLIDHDIDIKKGIELVQKAIAQDEKNSAYIDSLAWGFYKIGNCEEAKRLMKKVVDLIGDTDPEIKQHWQKIQNCEGKK